MREILSFNLYGKYYKHITQNDYENIFCVLCRKEARIKLFSIKASVYGEQNHIITD